jgi:hypothetical protein
MFAFNHLSTLPWEAVAQVQDEDLGDRVLQVGHKNGHRDWSIPRVGYFLIFVGVGSLVMTHIFLFGCVIRTF